VSGGIVNKDRVIEAVGSDVLNPPRSGLLVVFQQPAKIRK